MKHNEHSLLQMETKTVKTIKKMNKRNQESKTMISTKSYMYMVDGPWCEELKNQIWDGPFNLKRGGLAFF